MQLRFEGLVPDCCRRQRIDRTLWFVMSRVVPYALRMFWFSLFSLVLGAAVPWLARDDPLWSHSGRCRNYQYVQTEGNSNNNWLSLWQAVGALCLLVRQFPPFSTCACAFLLRFVLIFAVVLSDWTAHLREARRPLRPAPRLHLDDGPPLRVLPDLHGGRCPRAGQQPDLLRRGAAHRLPHARPHRL